MQTLNKRQRMHIYMDELTDDTPFCINCRYFVRHYVLQRRNTYRAINDGHCTHKRLKRCLSYDCCEYFCKTT